MDTVMIVVNGQEYEPFLVFDKTARNPLVVQYNVYKRQPRIDIRRHYRDDEGKLKPTYRGISLPLDLVSQVLETYQTLGNGESVMLDAAANEPLVVQSTVYRGQHRLDIRRHYFDAQGDLKPGRRGISLPTQGDLVPQVLEAVQTILAAAG